MLYDTALINGSIQCERLKTNNPLAFEEYIQTPYDNKTKPVTEGSEMSA